LGNSVLILGTESCPSCHVAKEQLKDLSPQYVSLSSFPTILVLDDKKEVIKVERGFGPSIKERILESVK